MSTNQRAPGLVSGQQLDSLRQQLSALQAAPHSVSIGDLASLIHAAHAELQFALPIAGFAARGTELHGSEDLSAIALTEDLREGQIQSLANVL